jgi:ligand-binding sensor domain-containing protein
MRIFFIKRIILTALASVLVLSCEKEQTGNTNQINWSIYKTSDGLASDHIYSVAIESDSIIWIGTDYGVSELAGKTWTTYRNNGLTVIVNSIAIDKQGNKWFATNGNGAVKLDKNNNWYMYSTSDGLADNNVYAVVEDDYNNLWFGTANGLTKFDGLNWTTYTTSDGLADNHVYSIAIDIQGNKWFGTNGGATKFDNINWTSFTYNGDQSNGIAGNGVVSITIDKKDTKWFGTWGGLSELNDGMWINHLEINWLAAGPVLSSALDSAGSMWFGSNGWGLAEYDGKTWTTYTSANESVLAPIYSIAVNSKNILWLATLDGLVKLEKRK